MIIGNFCAIVGSLIAAVNLVYSTYIIKEDNFPFYTFMTISSIVVVIISWLLSWIFNNPIDMFSTEPVNGAFGLLANW